MQQRRFNAKIQILAGKSSSSIYSALKPDIKSSERQINAEIALEDDAITLNMSSDDLSHIRAGLNSYLRLVNAASKCLDAAAL